MMTPEIRGRGLVCWLIAFLTGRTLENDFAAVFAHVWLSNGQSLRAFERAGWLSPPTVTWADRRRWC
jgi:hypothetical protein